MSEHQTPENMRVVFLIEDSLPNGRVGPELTPTLWSLISQGGWHAAGGVSVLASSTYPNHASFSTGTDVAAHRIFTNKVWNGHEYVCSSTIGPVGETIFTRAKDAGISTAAITGDQTMVGCMGGAEADIFWPLPGPPPSGLALDCLGYPANSEVLEQLSRSGALDTDIVYLHLNDPDSTLHKFGPEAPETIQRIREVDDDLATAVELLKPRWDDTVLFVVSDHEQETVDATQAPIDLVAELDHAGMPGDAHNEGTIGVVNNSPGADVLGRLDVLTGAIDLDTDVTLVWSDAGRVFGRSPTTLAGQHGSPRTRTQVATVSGGHPAVASIAADLSANQPHATSWAPRIQSLFGI